MSEAGFVDPAEDEANATALPPTSGVTCQQRHPAPSGEKAPGRTLQRPPHFPLPLLQQQRKRMHQTEPTSPFTQCVLITLGVHVASHTEKDPELQTADSSRQCDAKKPF